MRVPNLHSAPDRHLTKIGTFLEKSFIIWKNRTSQGVLEALIKLKQIS